jgi:UDP-N-acetylglucosamine 4,6-dehydratase
MNLTGKVLITGGTGTIGQAIIRRATEENWDCDITVFSRSWKSQADLKRKYPEITCVLGDVLDPVGTDMAIAGHDIVIHAAAQKHIVRGEENPLHTFETNVNGSINVLQACIKNNVKHVVGLSTDKSCHSANAYGATKYLMEKSFQQYAATYHGGDTEFHLVRYGNVLGSAGSFIHNWRICQQMKEPVWSTDPNMTRFWLTENEAIDIILHSLEIPSGKILVPMLKSAMVGDIEKWILGKPADNYVGKRPGEKTHETLITREELKYAHTCAQTPSGLCTSYQEPKYWPVEIFPTTAVIFEKLNTLDKVEDYGAYTSVLSTRLTKEEFLTMLGNI